VERLKNAVRLAHARWVMVREELRELKKDNKGLVTIEWVALTAGVVVAGVLIAWFILEAADATGGEVSAAMETIDPVESLTPAPTFGDGLAGEG
jgi:hypothetical protein